jgi:hypothetical protein
MSHPPKYRCLKCGAILTGWAVLTRCPNNWCCGDLKMRDEYVIFVRDTCQTYIARAAGKTASCTAGPRFAAERLAEKLFPGRLHGIKSINPYVYIASEEFSCSTKEAR